MRFDRARELARVPGGFHGGNLHGFGLRSVRVSAPRGRTAEEIGIPIAAKTGHPGFRTFPNRIARTKGSTGFSSSRAREFRSRLLEPCRARGDMNLVGNEARVR